MAESFMYDIAETVLEKLASQVLQEVGLAWGFKGELERLEETLSNILAVLLNAEEQQRKDRKLVACLGLLKDIIYDTDDLLDEFQCCPLQRQVVSRGSFDQKVRQFFSLSNPILFLFLIGHKVKEIRERLDKIASEKAQFDLAERDVGSYIGHRDRERTHSFVHPSDVVGRDRDREVDHLQTRLRNIPNGKKILLVLDDVWNEDRGRWIDFKSLLTSAANGSKILVTTRSHRVASIMGTVPEFKLGCLTHSACLSLFMKWAFKEGQEKDLPNLIEIGHEIVEKCKGVPLA